MNSFFQDLITSDSFYWFCALAGSGMFFIQFIINLFGLSDQDDFSEGNESVDARKLKWLSMQTITGFLMMFGWTAITCQNEFALPDEWTICIAIAIGFFSAMTIRSIFKMTDKLKSSGSIFNIEEAIGKEAYVYQRILKGEMGKISMTLQHFTYEIDAVSHHPEELASFSRVKIIGKINDKTVVVTPL